MPTLSFALRFNSMEMNALDLPVEVRKPNAALVARTRSSQSIDLPAGTYYVSAQLPAGQLITRQVKLEGPGAPVELKPDPEDEWTHEWDEERHFLDAPRPPRRRTSSLDVSNESWAAVRPKAVMAAAPPPMVEIAAGAGPIALTPGRPYLRVFSGNLLRGDRRIENAVLVLRQEQFEAGRIAYFGVQTQSPTPGVVQLLEVGAAALNVLVPQFARVAVSRRSEPTDFANSLFKLDIFAKNSSANMLLRYGREGAYQRAAVAAESERLLSEKIEDPFAAAVGAYSLLRAGELDRLHDWTKNLYNFFPWLPDGAALFGEHLARLGQHAQALGAFARLSDRGLPCVADGVFYSVERLKVYARLPRERSQGVDGDMARKALDALERFAIVVHRQRPFTSFPGLDPVDPSLARLEPGQQVVGAIEVSWL